MPFILAVLAIITAVGIWLYRARNAADRAGELLDMGRDVIGAARQWDFKRRTNIHPIDDIDDPKLAAGGLVVALTDLGAMPTVEQKSALVLGLQSQLQIDRNQAEELLVLGQWFIQASAGAEAAVPRLARQLKKLGGEPYLDPVLAVLKSAIQAGDDSLTPRQAEALADIATRFGRK